MIYRKEFAWLACVTLIALCAIPAMAEETPKELNGLPLVYEEDFESGDDGWVATDDKAWKVIEEDGNHVLALKRRSRYEPPVRSPHSIIRVEDLKVKDFILEARMKQTGKEYGHRDMCLFFGYQDPAHFYYVHIATQADAHANSIFLVNNEPRTSIAKERNKGTDWAKGYHQVRIERRVETGMIKVYFDDMEKPIMIAEDKTFGAGTLGFGSFDDTGNIDNVRVWGTKE